MKKESFFLSLFFTAFSASYCSRVSKKKDPVFTKMENGLEYKMSYSGFFKAGTQHLNLEETDTINGKKVFHATGTGWTTGPLSNGSLK